MEGNTKQLQSINKLMRKANRNAEFNWISKECKRYEIIVFYRVICIFVRTSVAA